MFSILMQAGWPIWPLLLASIVAMALIFERLATLRRSRVIPPGLLQRVAAEYQQHGGMSDAALSALEAQSPFGRILATGLRNLGCQREIVREAIDEAADIVDHELSRYLTTLGTIASASPLMGLFGTIVGMIEIFGSQSPAGASDPLMLANGISIALYNTGFGLVIAIPSMIFWRHFRAQVSGFILEMEQQTLRLVDILQTKRRG